MIKIRSMEKENFSITGNSIMTENGKMENFQEREYYTNLLETINNMKEHLKKASMMEKEYYMIGKVVIKNMKEHLKMVNIMEKE